MALNNNENLSRSAANGLKWSYLSSGCYMILQMIISIVMARLLTPSAFGTMALSNLVLAFTQYFVQMGMGSALIQKKEITNENVRVAFTVSITLSVIASVIIYICAPLIQPFFHGSEKNLTSVIRVMGLSFIFAGIQVVSTALLRRNFKFKILSISEIGGYLFGYGLVGIPMAIKGFGVWSLVGAVLSQKLFSSVVCNIAVKPICKPVWNKNAYKGLLCYGYKISIIGFLEFVSSNIDTLIIGKIFGTAPLGIYSRAKMLINLPMYYLGISLTKVLFPLFSKLSNDKDKLKKYYSIFYVTLGVFVIFLCFVAAVISDQIILLVLGDKWIDAVPLLRIISLFTPFVLLGNIEGVLCESCAKLNNKIITQIIYLTILTSGILILKNYSLIDVILFFSICHLIQFIGYGVIANSHLGIKTQQIKSNNLPFITVGIFAIIPVLLFIKVIPETVNIAIQLTGAFIISACSFVIYICYFRTEIVTDTIRIIINWAKMDGFYVLPNSISKLLRIPK